uniref:Uncharacterized protein n=1 Tax=Solanum lycopersicum TaxID=4081 RepID=K4B676_SOLLC
MQPRERAETTPSNSSRETSSWTTMERSKHAKTTIETPLLASTLVGEQPGGLRPQQQHQGDGATSCLPLRQKITTSSTQRAVIVSTDNSQGIVRMEIVVGSFMAVGLVRVRIIY